MNKSHIDFLEVKVSDGCNLNCKSCSYFANITEPKICDAEKIIKDLKLISENVDLTNLTIGGSEPLLNPNITEIVKSGREFFPKSLIILQTNGINISKMDDDFFKTVHDSNIRIKISIYPETKKYVSDNEKKLNEFDITYFYSTKEEEEVESVDIENYYYATKDSNNVLTSFSKKLLLNPDNNMYTSYRNCEVVKCTSLNNGKLYKCSTIANISALGEKYDLPQFKEVPDKYGIDIYSITDWDSVIKKLGKAEKCCKYCGKEQWVDWKLGEPELSDWIRSE